MTLRYLIGRHSNDVNVRPFAAEVAELLKDKPDQARLGAPPVSWPEIAIRSRMYEAARSKAKRGELRISSPIGYAWDRYRGDWDAGLAERIFDAVWTELTKEEREKVGFADRPAIGSVNAETVQRILEHIGRDLGRIPVLILDQFDDYQLAGREKFLGRRKNWIKPSDLVQRNRTWATISNLLLSGGIRVLVATRSNASAGLHSIRLTDQISGVSLNRLKVEWLSQWLAHITADDGKGEVIANPESGWSDLRKELERDLRPAGKSLGAVLPQQVRIVFLGLRKLSSLTPSEYRRAAAGTGVEALYIRDAIASAAAESGLAADQIRSLLSAFIDSEDPNNTKTKVLSSHDFSSLITDTGRVQRALDRLKRDEVVRETSSSDKGSHWRLDHDYIARAVAAEERAANKFVVQL
jgi:hypothetical protein